MSSPKVKQLLCGRAWGPPDGAYLQVPTYDRAPWGLLAQPGVSPFSFPLLVIGSIYVPHPTPNGWPPLRGGLSTPQPAPRPVPDLCLLRLFTHLPSPVGICTQDTPFTGSSQPLVVKAGWDQPPVSCVFQQAISLPACRTSRGKSRFTLLQLGFL